MRKLRPGHFLKVVGRDIREICYWDLRFEEDPVPHEKQWIERSWRTFAKPSTSA